MWSLRTPLLRESRIHFENCLFLPPHFLFPLHHNVIPGDKWRFFAFAYQGKQLKRRGILPSKKEIFCANLQQTVKFMISYMGKMEILGGKTRIIHRYLKSPLDMRFKKLSRYILYRKLLGTNRKINWRLRDWAKNVPTSCFVLGQHQLEWNEERHKELSDYYVQDVCFVKIQAVCSKITFKTCVARESQKTWGRLRLVSYCSCQNRRALVADTSQGQAF